MKNTLRGSDVAARLGGDELAILFHGIHSTEEARGAAARIQRVLAPAYEIEDRPVNTTSSTGIVLVTERYEKIVDLLRDADAAMYRAKEAGRARYEVF